ncbi:glycosyltransferase [Mucilaginibacter limnophilus]|uniref:Glycosyltransferase n=1 Tax=Mucilaginibacter limnophilus TaxID=1932778 RepID=A0A3S2V0G9_9SPHI|nr:glycosyltransferase family 4 protein [Mucilaginibacter limnophilus]RVT99806.1 glycosyltransferase [Mucilaginibacter limnophilus]
MNISYITTYNAEDVHQWSGLGYYIASALRQQKADLDMVGDINIQVPKYYDFKSKIYGRLGKRFLPEREPRLVKQAARQAESRIKLSTDIIFSPSTIPLAYIKSNRPKVFYTDATFAGMIDYYPFLTNICAESIRHGNEVEQAALDSCSLAFYSSDWAARSAVENYNVNPAKVKVMPFGANVDDSRVLSDIRAIVHKRDTTTCHLLFLGVEWERKGGNIAVEVARLLNENGLPTVLHVAGIPANVLHNKPLYIIDHGFISKHTVEGANKLCNLFNQCHFLLLPTRADCTPVVFPEANSFGMPCITTNTGGISSVIKDDINGKMFTLQTNAAEYAAYIHNQFLNYNAYQQLCLSSFNEYDTRLNWNASGCAIMDLLKAL